MPEYPFHLRREMERKKITQMELAKKSGVPQSVISDLCRGRTPNWQHANKLADALGVRLDKFRT